MNEGNADRDGAGRNEAGGTGSRRGAVAALAVVVGLVLGGLWLARTLRGVSAIQDCAMAGRTNCARIGG